MANWIKVEALLRNVEDSNKRESLGLDSLPIEVIVKPIVLDLNRVESFAPSLDEEGSEIPDEVDIVMYSGLAITLKMPFALFEKQAKKVG